MDIEVYRKQSATYGSSLDKAVWQQKGTKRNGRPHIPPRPILEVGPQQRKEVADIIRKHIAGRSVNPK
jgi:phage gpG-like protein